VWPWPAVDELVGQEDQFDAGRVFEAHASPKFGRVKIVPDTRMF
jgi:hypothetical protein